MRSKPEPGLQSGVGSSSEFERAGARMSSDLSTGEEGVSLLGSGGVRVGESSSRLLRGFYCYSVASEVFAIVSLSLFLPICLEQFARENGFVSPEHAVPCPPSSAATPSGDDLEQVRCAVRILRMWWLDTAGFAMLVFSCSVAIQALVVVSMSAPADDCSTRFRLMSAFACVGATTTMGFILLSSDSPVWFFAAFLSIIANVCFGASIVCLNSYLPELGRTSKETLAKSLELEEATTVLKAVRGASTSTSDERLMASQAWAKAQDDFVHVRSLNTSEISSTAVALGYAAGISILIVVLIPVTLLKGSTFALRFAIFLSGLIWGGGSVPALLWLRPTANMTVAQKPYISFRNSMKESWRGLGRMFLEWRRLPNAFIFLAAWFLLSDSFATLTSVAMLFGKTTLAMTTPTLILIAIISPLSGIAGAVLFPRLQRTYLLWTNLQILLLLVGLACLVPVWGLLALRQQWQMFLLAVVFGAIYGAFQSFARTCYSELVPAVQAQKWFGLYSLTDKSSSFLGPLLVAFITNHTGQIRHGFWLILAMFLLALPILAQVDMDAGRADAEEFQRQLLDFREVDEHSPP